MTSTLYPHQKEAIEKLRSGSILCGGVGTGKSITAIAYYFFKVCGGIFEDDVPHMTTPKDLVIITTARKRDTKEWIGDMNKFGLVDAEERCRCSVSIVVDSWNNIKKYENVQTDTFYIFDEQRIVGSGAWVKSFLKIAKKHPWILLSATPGDTWMDYVAVFIANGFYKNRTEFISRHAIYSRYSKYPKIDRFVDCTRLERLRRSITVNMNFQKHTVQHYIEKKADYNRNVYKSVWRGRWNPFDNKPIKNVSELFSLIRRVCNSDESRLNIVRDLWKEHDRMIVFYNFDYELEALKNIRTSDVAGDIAEWNGHEHEPVPNSDRWLYLVQYASGCEGWNCTTTDTIVFFSQSYSHKMTVQAAGRIDRLNTPYRDLYYYVLKCDAPIDRAIAAALKAKKNFSEASFYRE